jgi:hypothetical protein
LKEIKREKIRGEVALEGEVIESEAAPVESELKEESSLDNSSA